MAEQIVITDDEKEITDLVAASLSGAGYEVHKFYNATDAWEYIENHEVDLAILDVMLPDMDGFTLCGKIREKYYFPIIMLTAKVDAVDKITGLTMGADDYITKPFLPMELIARVRTQLRRSTKYNVLEAKKEEVSEISIRGLYISRTHHKCILNEEMLDLTPMEFRIIWYLASHQGEVVSSEKLFEEVWGEKFMDSNNTVMAHIARVREKMHEKPRKPKYIKTIWGVGYTIE